MNQAGGLFVWAATALRHVADGEMFAAKCLQDLLNGPGDSSPIRQSLDRIYLTVLGEAMRGGYSEAERR